MSSPERFGGRRDYGISPVPGSERVNHKVIDTKEVLYKVDNRFYERTT